MQGKVVKIFSNLFRVRTREGEFDFSCRKNLKDGGVFVGDEVEVNEADKVIENVLPRKNLLIRPPLANLDQLIIVVASEPVPDFMIVDKLILFCMINNVEPVLCLNKLDLDDVDLKAYSFLKVIKVSAKSGQNLEELKKLFKGKVSAFAGQSAVGKSALINALVPEASALEGELSQKIKRGKNTTRHAQLYLLGPKTFLADTAGFTALDETLLNVDYSRLWTYYPDFISFAKNCKYRSCEHIQEEDCGVRQAVRESKLDKGRYLRYKSIMANLKQNWRKTHG